MSSQIATTTLPRLAPIDRPSSWFVRLLAFAMRLQLGKVMTPLTVVYARMPRITLPQLMMLRLAETGLSLDKELVALLQTRVSMSNGCTFCADLHEAYAARKGAARNKFAALADPEGSGCFTPRELAALRFADEAARVGRTEDATFEALRAHFDERQIVELTWLCAFTTYLNRLAVPLGIGSDNFCALLPTG